MLGGHGGGGLFPEAGEDVVDKLGLHILAQVNSITQEVEGQFSSKNRAEINKLRVDREVDAVLDVVGQHLGVVQHGDGHLVGVQDEMGALQAAKHQVPGKWSQTHNLPLEVLAEEL